MTDNEKAATFIGWKPDQKCKTTKVECRHFDQPWFDHNSEESKRWLKEGGEHPPFAEHDIPAPDMGKPENYMRALKEVAEIHFVRLTVNSKTSGVVWTRIGHNIDARSPVEALAALYDAEHEKHDAA